MGNSVQLAVNSTQASRPEFHTSALRSIHSAVTSALSGGSIFDRHPPALKPEEPLRLAIISSRHGIGGSVTDLIHIKAIQNAAKEKFTERPIQIHVFSANRLAFESLESSSIIFHKDAFHTPLPSSTTLDSLSPLKGQEFLATCQNIKPHYVVALDNANERRDWNIGELLKLPSLAAAVFSTSSLPRSGFAAVEELVITAPGHSTIPLTLPAIPGEGRSSIHSVYAESACISLLFGGSPKPHQSVALPDLKWAKQTYLDLGYSPEKHSRLVYIHEGTSTTLKELTPEQIKAVLKATFEELRGVNLDPQTIFFAVSPQPVQRPEVAQAYLDTLKELGASFALLPAQTSIGQAKALIALGTALTADTFAYHAAVALGGAVSGHFSNPDIVPLPTWGHGHSVGADMNPSAIEDLLIKGDLNPATIRRIAINNALVIDLGFQTTYAARAALGFTWEQIP